MPELLAAVLQATTTGVPDALDRLDKIIKVVAVVLGGIWTYLNYVRGRTFKRRLELSVTGKLLQSGSNILVTGVAQVKNVGLSKVSISRTPSAIMIDDLYIDSSAPDKVASEEVGIQDVLADHGWVEPGEVIQESFLVPLLPRMNRVASRIRMRIVSRSLLFKNIEWNADCIAEPASAVVVTAG